MNNEAYRKLLDHKARTDFATFVFRVFQTVVPGQQFSPNWHIQALAWHLDQCVRGPCKRLIVTMPPRTLKSICVSVALPAWILAHDPTRRVICISYSLDLAGKFALDSRAVMESAWYRRLFPRTRVSRARDRELDFMTTARGSRYATSPGATLTGRGGNFIILDDLIKPTDAMSEAVRTSVNDWIDRTLYTRLDDKISDVIVGAMQRLHVDDPIGHILRKNENWRQLNLPAITEVEQRIPIGPDRSHIWRPGELLHPDREPPEVLERLKCEMGTLSFSAQYLQCPIPPEGEIIKWSWFRFYDEVPAAAREDRIIQSWDTASTASELSDWSACTTWRIHGGKYYLIDVLRVRLTYPELRHRIIDHAKAWNAELVLIEDRGSGMALVQDLQDYDGGDVPDIIPYEPWADKVTRMHRYSARIEAGRVYLPSSAPWLEEFRAELLQFPHGKHDDQVDSVSQFLSWAENERHERIGLVGYFDFQLGRIVYYD